MPGIVRFEFMEDGETFTALLCPLCVLDGRRLFKEAHALMKKDRLERSRSGGDIIPGP